MWSIPTMGKSSHPNQPEVCLMKNFPSAKLFEILQTCDPSFRSICPGVNPNISRPPPSCERNCEKAFANVGISCSLSTLPLIPFLSACRPITSKQTPGMSASANKKRGSCKMRASCGPLVNILRPGRSTFLPLPLAHMHTHSHTTRVGNLSTSHISNLTYLRCTSLSAPCLFCVFLNLYSSRLCVQRELTGAWGVKVWELRRVEVLGCRNTSKKIRMSGGEESHQSAFHRGREDDDDKSKIVRICYFGNIVISCML